MATKSLKQDADGERLCRMTTLEKIRAEICEERSKHNMSCSDCLDIIDKYAEQEPKTGHWIDMPIGFKCSNCNELEDRTTKFCPNCGAKIESEDKE